MPYPKAHYYTAGLILLSFWGFWPGYLSHLPAMLWQHHAHGMTAGFWLLLLTAQSWAIHSGRRDLHRGLGKALFVAAPLFLAGVFLVIGIKASLGEWREMVGAHLLAYDLVVIAVFSYLVFGALAHRRNVQLHARYLLATTFLVVGPIVSRILSQIVPAFGPDPAHGPVRALMSLHVSTVLAIVVALVLYARSRKFGAPFLVIAMAMAVQVTGYITVGGAEWLSRINAAFAQMSMGSMALLGVVFGIVVVFSGWRAGARSPDRGGTDP